MMAQRKETEGRWKRARERIGCASEMRERETKRGGTGAAKGVGIRFAADNASGSSQEIHGRGAEINVLLHLHSYLSSSVPRIPHLTPLFHSPTSPLLTLPLCVRCVRSFSDSISALTFSPCSPTGWPTSSPPPIPRCVVVPRFTGSPSKHPQTRRRAVGSANPFAIFFAPRRCFKDFGALPGGGI